MSCADVLEFLAEFLVLALDRIDAMPREDLRQSGNSYFGLLRQASHSHGDRAVLANRLRDRGLAVTQRLTKAYG